MLLEKSQAIAGIVELHGVNREAISQFVRGNVVYSACFWINEFGQSCFFSTLFNDLPGTVAVYTED